jgi:hypothetical protein
MAAFDTVVATASTSPHGDRCQDRAATFVAPAGSPSAGVVVCDGVGALEGSGRVAEEVARLAAAHLAERGVAGGLWHLDETLAEAPPAGEEGATTLVAVGAEASGLVGHMLIGNGALIEVEPADGWPGAARLRWTDLVLPQIRWEGGRPALRSILPTPDGVPEAAKGCRQVPAGRPRMYLACSDGISSDEARSEGDAPDGTRWKQVPAQLARLVADVATAWPELVGPEVPTGEALSGRLAESLDRMLEDGLLEDDATVGALLMRPSTPADGGELS